MSNTNNDIRKVAKNGPIKARITSMSNFFITIFIQLKRLGVISENYDGFLTYMQAKVKLYAKEVLLIIIG
jgi:hypothetical protein